MANSKDEELREKIVVLYFNMLVKGNTMASVANLTDATLKKGEGFIDEAMELIKQYGIEQRLDEVKELYKSTIGNADWPQNYSFSRSEMAEPLNKRLAELTSLKQKKESE